MLFLLWWCFDDHLATALNAPGLGELPLWVPLLMNLALCAIHHSKSND